MSNAQDLRAIFQDVQISGKFERNQVLAVLNIFIDMVERLEKVERICEIQRPG